ncbi:MAG: GAF domain-containing SpoIIE family protein phosphatase [Fodinibius sp.]|nr:GAF domain-containing SpoIIE family protein phosphatase [Fodinibius sp.]
MGQSKDAIESSTVDGALNDDRLNLLMKLTAQINSNLDLDNLLLDIIQAAKRIMKCEASSLMLYDEDKDCLVLSIPTGPATDEVSGKEIPKDHGIGGWVFRNLEPVIVNDVSRDDRFLGDIEPEVFETRNIICVPLLNEEEEVIGIIQALNRRDNTDFSEEEIPIFQALANQAAIAIENARLHEQQKQKVLLEQKLDLARSIQSGFAPEQSPDLPGYRIAGITKPATWVGGDYYDFISNDSGSEVLALGDVTGKGIPASLLMASVRSVLRTQFENDHSLPKTIELVNRSIHRDTPITKFITMFCGQLDPLTHTFSYVNAGHTDAFHLDYEAQEVTHLNTGGLMLGIMEDETYEQGTIGLEPGQQIIIYSDGINEAHNAEGELYGEGRFKEWLLNHPDCSPQETIDLLIEDVKKFSKSDEQHDDITLIVVKRTS